MCVICSVVLWLQYGDSFTEDATDESLRETFNKVGEKVRPAEYNLPVTARDFLVTANDLIHLQ